MAESEIQTDFFKFFNDEYQHFILECDIENKKIFFLENRWINEEFKDREELKAHYNIDQNLKLNFSRTLSEDCDAIIIEPNFLRFLNNKENFYYLKIKEWLKEHPTELLYWCAFFKFFKDHNFPVDSKICEDLHSRNSEYFYNNRKEILEEVNLSVCNLSNQKSREIVVWIYNYLTSYLKNDYISNYYELENYIKEDIVYNDSLDRYYENQYFSKNGFDITNGDPITYIDVGARDGFTIFRFLDFSKNIFHSIYGFEQDSDIFARTKNSLSNIDNNLFKKIYLYNKNADDSENSNLDKMLLDDNGSYDSIKGETLLKIYSFNCWSTINGAREFIKCKKPYIVMNYELCNNPDISFNIFKTINLIKELMPESKIYLEITNIFLNAAIIFVVPPKLEESEV